MASVSVEFHRFVSTTLLYTFLYTLNATTAAAVATFVAVRECESWKSSYLLSPLLTSQSFAIRLQTPNSVHTCIAHTINWLRKIHWHIETEGRFFFLFVCSISDNQNRNHALSVSLILCLRLWFHVRVRLHFRLCRWFVYFMLFHRLRLAASETTGELKKVETLSGIVFFLILYFIDEI